MGKSRVPDTNTSSHKSLSHDWLFVTPWTVARQATLSTELPRQETWTGLPFPSLGAILYPGIKPKSPTSRLLQWQEDSLPLSHLKSRSSPTQKLSNPFQSHLINRCILALPSQHGKFRSFYISLCQERGWRPKIHIFFYSKKIPQWAKPHKLPSVSWYYDSIT